jgi:hypothetical protein
VTQQELASRYVELANDVRELQISHLALTASVARQLFPSREKAVVWIESVMALEAEVFADDPTLQGHALILRALRSWNPAES